MFCGPIENALRRGWQAIQPLDHPLFLAATAAFGTLIWRLRVESSPPGTTARERASRVTGYTHLKRTTAALGQKRHNAMKSPTLSNSQGLAILRIAVGILFLIFAQYKILST